VELVQVTAVVRLTVSFQLCLMELAQVTAVTRLTVSYQLCSVELAQVTSVARLTLSFQLLHMYLSAGYMLRVVQLANTPQNHLHIFRPSS
jgi:hypothetical protein